MHTCRYCLLLQELCEGDLGDFTRKVRDMLYGQNSELANVYSLAPILLVRACICVLVIAAGHASVS